MNKTKRGKSTQCKSYVANGSEIQNIEEATHEILDELSYSEWYCSHCHSDSQDNNIILAKVDYLK